MRDWRRYVRERLPLARIHPARENDIVAELAAHVEQAYSEARAGGLDDAEALRNVEQRFANWEQLAREIEVAEPRSGKAARAGLFGGILQDIRYACRLMRKNPTFTAIAACTLAFGIGANTAVFTMADAITLRGLPYPHSEELMAVETHWTKQPEIAPWTSAPDLFDIAGRAHSFSAIAGVSPAWQLLFTGRGDAESLEGLFVSSSFFSIFQTRPELGRLFTGAENDQGRPAPVAVLSYDFWKARFGGRDNVLGQTMTLDGRQYTVVGVLPRDFRYLGDPLTGTATVIDVWLPLSANPLTTASRTVRFLKVVARRKPGILPQRAVEEMRSIGNALTERYPDADRGMTYDATLLSTRVNGKYRTAMLLLLAAVGFVLLMACANVANLMLTRSAARQRDFGIRAALGASRYRLLRQTIIEGAAVAILGGLVGLLVAYAGVRFLIKAAPPSLVQTHPMRLDWRALTFTAVAVLAAAIFAGLAPAWRAMGVGISSSLRQSGRGFTQSNRALRSALVVAEVSFALVLLIGAGLLIRSVQRLLDVNPGFDARNLLTISTQTPAAAASPAQRTAYYLRIREALLSEPGVVEVAAISRLPLKGSDLGTAVMIEGKTVPGEQLPDVEYRVAAPTYLRAMRIPLRAGRWFNEHDIPGSQRVAVINETMARTLWRGQNPLGSRVKLGPNPSAPWITIIGIIGDVRHSGLDIDPRPEVYSPYAFSPLFAPILVIRTRQDPAAAANELAAKIRSVDAASIPVFDVYTMQTLVDRSTSQRRFVMWLLTGFAGAALFLAALGVYGTVSYAVAQRTKEIGVRLALGASPASALRLVFRDGMQLAILGVVAGGLAAMGLTQLMRKLLFGVQPLDPVAFPAAIATLSAFAAVACYVPARRATRVDPLTALRDE